ncbi:MAG: hypothetical protein MI741_14295, partial [Rhodospirillales bacterium]|nr:hypothetical protein [Rhodospirillales bacterium]
GATFFFFLRTVVGSDLVAEVRGRGLMVAVDFADKTVGDRIYDGLLDRGYIVCNRGGTFRIDPPLVIEEAELVRFVEVFRGLLAAE